MSKNDIQMGHSNGRKSTAPIRSKVLDNELTDRVDGRDRCSVRRMCGSTVGVSGLYYLPAITNIFLSHSTSERSAMQ